MPKKQAKVYPELQLTINGLPWVACISSRGMKDLCGLTTRDSRKITIAPSTTKDLILLRQTFFHELFHAQVSSLSNDADANTVEEEAAAESVGTYWAAHGHEEYPRISAWVDEVYRISKEG